MKRLLIFILLLPLLGAGSQGVMTGGSRKVFASGPAPPAPIVHLAICGDTTSSSGCTPSSSTTVYDSGPDHNVMTWNGTQSGTSNWYSATSGSLPYAGTFNGTDNYIASSVPTTTGFGYPFSVSVWAKGGSEPANSRIVDMNWGSYFSVFVSGSTFGQCVTGTCTSGGTLSSSSLTFYTLTYDGTNYNVFVGGSLVTGPVAATPPSPYNHSLIVGGGTSTFFSGLIQDVRIYNVALTSGQIAAMYAAGPS